MIKNYGSLYAVARDTGVPWSVLYRFVSDKRDIYMETADRLCAFFEMRLTRPKRAKDRSPYKRT